MQLNLTKFQNILTNAKAGEGGRQFDMALQVLGTSFSYEIEVPNGGSTVVQLDFTAKRDNNEYKLQARVYIKERFFNLRYSLDVPEDVRAQLCDRIENALKRAYSETVKGEAR